MIATIEKTETGEEWLSLEIEFISERRDIKVIAKALTDAKKPYGSRSICGKIDKITFQLVTA